MISLLATSNNSFLLLLFGLVASFGSTSTQRQTQLLGNRRSWATAWVDTARSNGSVLLTVSPSCTYSLILPWSSLFFKKGPMPRSVTTGLARSGSSRGDPSLLLTSHPPHCLCPLQSPAPPHHKHIAIGLFSLSSSTASFCPVSFWIRFSWYL